MTEMYVNVRSSNTRVRCPFHWPQYAMLVGLIVRDHPTTETLFGRTLTPVPQVAHWVLADGCRVAWEDYQLVTESESHSYFEPKAAVPARKVDRCPCCRQRGITQNLLDPERGQYVWSVHGTVTGKCSYSGQIVGNTTKGEDKMTDSRQLSELRATLQKAREARELDQKIDAAGIIVETLDGFAAGSIIRFDKGYAEDHNKPAGTYTYVGLKVAGTFGRSAAWYLTGAESGPMNSDDVAAFMLAGQAVTEYQLLGAAENTFSIVLGDAPATPAAPAV